MSRGEKDLEKDERAKQIQARLAEIEKLKKEKKREEMRREEELKREEARGQRTEQREEDEKQGGKSDEPEMTPHKSLLQCTRDVFYHLIAAPTYQKNISVDDPKTPPRTSLSPPLSVSPTPPHAPSQPSQKVTQSQPSDTRAGKSPSLFDIAAQEAKKRREREEDLLTSPPPASIKMANPHLKREAISSTPLHPPTQEHCRQLEYLVRSEESVSKLYLSQLSKSTDVPLEFFRVSAEVIRHLMDHNKDGVFTSFLLCLDLIYFLCHQHATFLALLSRDMDSSDHHFHDFEFQFYSILVKITASNLGYNSKAAAVTALQVGERITTRMIGTPALSRPCVKLDDKIFSTADGASLGPTLMFFAWEDTKRALCGALEEIVMNGHSSLLEESNNCSNLTASSDKKPWRVTPQFIHLLQTLLCFLDPASLDHKMIEWGLRRGIFVYIHWVSIYTQKSDILFRLYAEIFCRLLNKEINTLGSHEMKEIWEHLPIVCRYLGHSPIRPHIQRIVEKMKELNHQFVTSRPVHVSETVLQDSCQTSLAQIVIPSVDNGQQSTVNDQHKLEASTQTEMVFASHTERIDGTATPMENTNGPASSEENIDQLTIPVHKEHPSVSHMEQTHQLMVSTEESDQPESPTEEPGQPVNPTEESDQPVSPTEESDQLVSPTEESDQPVSPTEEPDQPVSPTEEPDQPVNTTEEPDQPVNPTEESDQPVSPTEESDQPVNPTEEPDQPVNLTEEPYQPVSPTEESDQPVSPTEESDQPVNPTEEPYQPVSPTEESTWHQRVWQHKEHPSVSPMEQTHQLMVSTEESDQPVSPTEESDQPASPTEEPDQPVSPTEESDQPVSPTEEPDQPVNPTEKIDQPVNPTEETDQLIVPTVDRESEIPKGADEAQIIFDTPQEKPENACAKAENIVETTPGPVEPEIVHTNTETSHTSTKIAPEEHVDMMEQEDKSTQERIQEKDNTVHAPVESLATQDDIDAMDTDNGTENNHENFSSLSRAEQLTKDINRTTHARGRLSIP
ncbi:hypothetical protein PROFUN_12172 [Planoprotostelium fungivorum]|uniref:Uncharacterized protein n=1 Tax=Planoprotostelium fungivorum TaxID=1890364 RepID=A0A2P6N8G0_9EUKA|nr:hypothetical protein PROFUN_12172 [Planoprotostelium fungivorum]